MAIWGLWEVLDEHLEISTWIAIIFPFVLGIGGQALIDHDKLWLGLGIGGLTMFISRLADLLLVTTDWVKVSVLRQPRRGPT